MVAVPSTFTGLLEQLCIGLFRQQISSSIFAIIAFHRDLHLVPLCKALQSGAQGVVKSRVKVQEEEPAFHQVDVQCHDLPIELGLVLIALPSTPPGSRPPVVGLLLLFTAIVSPPSFTTVRA